MNNSLSTLKGPLLIQALFSVAAVVWIAFIRWPSGFLAIIFVGLVLFGGMVCWFGVRRNRKLYLPATMLAWLIGGFLFSNYGITPPFDRFWGAFEYDIETGWRPLPNLKQYEMKLRNNTAYLVDTDAGGYRNDLPYPANGRLDIIVQGDSNAFGAGLESENTFCGMINRSVKEACFNVGVSGYDMNNFYFQFKRLVRSFKVDQRVVMFNLGNDFSISALETPYLIRRPYLYVDDKGEVVERHRIPMPVIKQIYGYRFIEKYREYDPTLAPYEKGRGWGNALPDWIVNFPALQFLVFRYETQISKAVSAINSLFGTAGPEPRPNWKMSPFYGDWILLKRERWPKPFDLYAVDFEKILDAFVKQHPQTSLVLFPMRKQVIKAETDAAVERLMAAGYDRRDIDLTSINRLIRAAAQNAGARAIDLTDVFRSQKNPERLYLKDDQHLSPAGMIMLAERLIKELALKRK